eukprot:m.51692 g.51692  ORF g.51692 m.51692 type:complete len:1078 (+) comp12241_c0_seq3:438-3671(+)
MAGGALSAADLGSVLQGTLAPDRATREAAEAKLNECLSLPGTCVLLLELVGSLPPAHAAIAQAAALCLKNHLKYAWHTSLSSQERHQLRTHLLPVLGTVETPLVIRPLVLCLSPMLADLSLTEALVDEIVRFLQVSWDGGRQAQTAAAVRCIKMIFRTALSNPEVSRMLQAKLQSCLGLLFRLLGIATEAGHCVIRKLICGTLRISMHVCVLDPVFQDYGMLELWLNAIYKVIREDVRGPAEQQALDWKSKARLVDTWQNLIAQSPLPLSGQEGPPGALKQPIQDLLYSSYGAMFQHFLVIVSRDAYLTDSDVDRSYAKCAISVLHCVAQDACIRVRVRESYVYPSAEALLTKILFNFMRLAPVDVQLMVDSPREYANRNGEELRHALSCPHGMASCDECEICSEQTLSQQTMSTPRSAAMMATKEILIRDTHGLIGPYFEFVKQVFAATASPTPGVSVEQRVATRVAAVRSFSCLADSLLEVKTEALLPEAYRFVTEMLLPMYGQLEPTEGDCHIKAVMLNCLVRCMLFLCVPAGEHTTPELLQPPLQIIMQALCDANLGVRVHALLAFKECIWHQTLQSPLQRMVPTIMSWLVELFRSRHPGGEQLVDALCSCFYHFPRHLGATSPQQDPTPAEFQNIFTTHMQVCTEFIARFFEHKERLASAGQQQFAVEREVAQYIGAVHAVVLSCPMPGMRDQSGLRQMFAQMLLPYISAILSPEILSMAYRHGADAEVADVLTTLPRNDPNICLAAIPIICKALRTVPVMSELFVPQLCDFVHVCGVRLFVNVDGSLTEIAALLTATVMDLVKPSNPYVLSRCMGVELARSCMLVSSCNGIPEHIYTPLLHAAQQTQVSAKTTEVCALFVLPVGQFLAQQAQARTQQGAAKYEIQFAMRLLCAFSAALTVDPHGTVQTLVSQNLHLAIPFIADLWSEVLVCFKRRRRFDFRLMALGLTGLLEVASTVEWPVPLLQCITSTCVLALTYLHQLNQRLDSGEIDEDSDDEDSDDGEEPSVLDFEHFPELDDAILDREEARFMEAIKSLISRRRDLGQSLTAGLGHDVAKLFTHIITRNRGLHPG